MGVSGLAGLRARVKALGAWGFTVGFRFGVGVEVRSLSGKMKGMQEHTATLHCSANLNKKL